MSTVAEPSRYGSLAEHYRDAARTKPILVEVRCIRRRIPTRGSVRLHILSAEEYLKDATQWAQTASSQRSMLLRAAAEITAAIEAIDGGER